MKRRYKELELLLQETKRIAHEEFFAKLQSRIWVMKHTVLLY